MKKFLALLLVTMMVLSLAACGGSDEPAESAPSTSNVTSEPEEGETTDSITITDKNGEEVSQEKLAELIEAYNTIAVPYNDVVTAANENGWMDDEQTATELDALSNTLGYIGAGLTEDISMLDGSDFDTLIDTLENDFPSVIDELAERVSVPYGE